MIKAVVFDLDDTLYPEIEYVKSGFYHISKFLERKLNYKSEIIYQDLFNLFKENHSNVFNRYYELKGIKYSKDDIFLLVNEYRNHNPNIKYYDDVIPFLNVLKDKEIKTGIITDGYKNAQKRKLEALNAYKIFDKIIVTDELGKEYWKPNPKSFEIMKNTLNVDYSEMIYIGDNPNKDFFISSIYPIRSIRINRLEGLYSKCKNVLKDYSNIQIKTFKNHVGIILQ